MEIDVNKLQHVGIPVLDAEKVAKWYIETLNFKTVGTFDLGPMIIKFISLGELTLELIQPKDGPMKEGIEKGTVAKIHHMAYDVSDIDKAFAQAQAAGFEITTPITANTLFDNGSKYFMGIGPAGELLEFNQIL